MTDFFRQYGLLIALSVIVMIYMLYLQLFRRKPARRVSYVADYTKKAVLNDIETHNRILYEDASRTPIFWIYKYGNRVKLLQRLRNSFPYPLRGDEVYVEIDITLEKFTTALSARTHVHGLQSLTRGMSDLLAHGEPYKVYPLDTMPSWIFFR